MTFSTTPASDVTATDPCVLHFTRRNTLDSGLLDILRWWIFRAYKLTSVTERIFERPYCSGVKDLHNICHAAIMTFWCGMGEAVQIVIAINYRLLANSKSGGYVFYRQELSFHLDFKTNI